MTVTSAAFYSKLNIFQLLPTRKKWQAQNPQCGIETQHLVTLLNFLSMQGSHCKQLKKYIYAGLSAGIGTELQYPSSSAHHMTLSHAPLIMCTCSLLHLTSTPLFKFWFSPCVVWPAFIECYFLLLCAHFMFLLFILQFLKKNGLHLHPPLPQITDKLLHSTKTNKIFGVFLPTKL